jgi:hypothetical protein
MVSIDCAYCGHGFDEHARNGCGWVSGVVMDIHELPEVCPCLLPFGGEASRIIQLLEPEEQFVREQPFTIEEVAGLVSEDDFQAVLTAHEALRKRTEELGPLR